VRDDALAPPGPDALAVAFARVLRQSGVPVATASVVEFTRALAVIDVARRSSVYWAGRTTLVSRPDDVAAYDRAFAACWSGDRVPSEPVTHEERAVVALDAGGDEPDPPSDGTPRVPAVAVRWSPVEVLRHRDFAAYDAAEHAEARRLMADLRLAGALRPTRRRRPSPRAHGRPDLRRTVRRTLRAGGEVTRAFHAAGATPRRVVLLLDVSGSMEPYARAFVRFLHAAVVGRGRVDAFALGTRVTRVTRELSSRDPDAAIRAAAERVVDWAGGTRLGPCLREFNDRWGVRGLARGAVVVILSDGWDRADPELLGEQMARLRRVAHRVVWVNPLKASPGYAPLARGMAAALPHVDDFVEGHSLAALEELAEVIAR
jgi:uncharacterized protein with von Willebrand factor type A (vWA) domain